MGNTEIETAMTTAEMQAAATLAAGIAPPGATPKKAIEIYRELLTELRAIRPKR